MAKGLLSQREMPPEGAQPQPQAALDAEGATPGDQQQASPEEQQQYEMIVDRAFRLIYGEQSFDAVLDTLRSSKEEPTDGLAAVTANVVFRVHESAHQNGVKLSGDALFQAGADIMADIAETAAKARIHDYSEEELEVAWFKALDRYGPMAQNAGLIDNEAARQEFQQMVEADQAGTLGEQMPMLRQAAENVEIVEGEDGGQQQPADRRAPRRGMLGG